ncbi:DUF2069 domain-containing protein [Larsenimonas rhizosphaerae]|uniref:DUF2069 domain-containing protein n=1 Tax=Larsenimonas rhizosphaerae TaxID=2944682 RepID=A0AA41ZEX4_9GAMM|nr:DUF2069 domain-containing protein [Larsenimonas rhizosphaerae]MCM2130647.1 DUF2069 domain-containing protein [Larsenimonas rhizosphaerae]MCX2523351.1 DUF2069 domain-containing protein [Larsenimonas rhizosphaerae]
MTPEAQPAKRPMPVIVSYTVLMVIAIANGLWLMALHNVEPLPVVIRLAPLALLATVFWLPRTRGFVWLAFVGLIYAIQSILMIKAPGQWPWSVAETLAASALLITALKQARRLRHAERHAETTGKRTTK